MSMTDLAPFPVYSLNVDPAKQAFSKVGGAIDKHDYRRAIEFASAALAGIQELLTMTVLEHRAYAFGMQGLFGEAIRDAQDMIALVPTLSMGYFQLGNIYRMQGKQLSAIEAYDTGLKIAPTSHPYHEQMMKNRELATERSKSRIDFVARLPVEIVDGIISLLPSEAKSTSLTVSSVWRNKIFKCSDTWKTLMCSSEKDDWATALIPHIGTHVEDLIINTTDRRVFLRYLHCMNAGYFDKLKALKLAEKATRHINMNVLLPVGNAFWHVRNTLTKLILSLSPNSGVIAILDLLSICSNLKSLEYSTTYPLSTMIGELSLPYSHNTLIDMQLVAKSITSQDIRKILCHCKRVRRLLLNGSDTTVLDNIDKICPSLQIFGFNASVNAVAQLGIAESENRVPGLCRFYTNNGGPKEPASAVLPLLRRNMHSLRTLHINISAERSQSNLATVYADLELKNMNRLTFRGDDSGIIQPLLLRSIFTCKTLTHVAASASRDIPGLVNTLAVLPQLEFLEISHDHRTAVGEPNLIHLFEQYSKESQSKQRLKVIWLRYCKAIVTDNVLNALASIHTLEEIAFEGLSNVSTQAVNNVFEKLGNGVSEVRLTEMNAITDSSLVAIGKNLTGMKRIRLEKLKTVTDRGIKDLIEKAPKLESLTLVNCESVTPKGIRQAKKSIKDVVVVG